ncbi:uncharacterized protein [Typha latifolia]|uniref:uncharacterized protein n=1 Tax=Typha latifolia TaxID=4733 RepID=UPI003C2BB0AA
MHAKSKISGMLPKGFKADKCKTSLKLGMARLKLMKNKKDIQVKQMRREVAQLLETGQDQTARIRVEHVIREEKMMSAYELIELYSELIVARLPIISSQKNCPIDLKEAICSVIFASARCSDIPELMDVRKHFSAKYGKEFMTAALEVRPDCGVSHMIIEKLSARAPDLETKFKILTAIAQEHNVEWDSKAFEEQIRKPNDELLKGPSTFTGTGKMTMEPFTLQTAPAPAKTEWTETIPRNEVASKPTSQYSFSDEKLKAPETSPHNFSSDSKSPEIKSGEDEVKLSHSEERSSSNRTTWDMEFKDATSAAQAAAESAERASMAARAAAELASRGKYSEQHSTGSHKPSTSSSRNGHGDESERKSSDISKLDIHNPQVIQSSNSKDAESTFSGHASIGNLSPARSLSPTHSRGSSTGDDVSEDNLEEPVSKTHDFVEKSSSEAEFAVNNYRDSFSGAVGIKNYNNSFTSHDTSKPDEDIIWDDHKGTTLDDYSTAAFDRYDYDSDEHSLFGRSSKINLFDSSPPAEREQPSGFEDHSSFLMSKDWSSKQLRSESLGKGRHSSPFLARETHPSEVSERISVSLQSQPNDAPPTYDSDGLNTENEDEIDKVMHTEDMTSNSFLQIQRSSSSSGPHHFFDENKEVKEAWGSYPFPSDINEELKEAESSSADKSWKRSSFSVHNNQQSQRDNMALRSPDNSGRGKISSFTEEDPESWQSKDLSEESEARDKYEMQSLAFDSKVSVNSNDTNESERSLNFDRLTGGFKSRGYVRPPYVKGHSNDALSKGISDDTFGIEKPISSNMDEAYVDVGLNEGKLYQEQHLEFSTPKSETSRKDFDKADGLLSHRTVGSGISRGKVSLRSSRSGEDNPSIIQNSAVSQYDKTSESSVSLAHESSIQRQHRKDYESIPLEQTRESSTFAGKSTVSSLTDSSNSYVNQRQEFHDEKRGAKAAKETSSRMPRSNLDFDGNEEEESEPRYTLGRRGSRDTKLSRRTKDVPSDARKGSLRRNIYSSEMETAGEKESKPSQSKDPSVESSSSREVRLAINLDKKDTSIQSNLSTRQPLAKPSESEPSAFSTSLKSPEGGTTRALNREDDGNSKTSSSSIAGSTSREGSFKNASHVHPKLPDYDSFAAHFQSLRKSRG